MSPLDTDFDPAPAAEALAAAWRSGAQLVELRAAIRPATLTAGYALQDRLIASMGAALGEPPSGWKLGVGSPATLRKAQLERGLIGRLFASRMHASGATVVVPRAGTITVEFEIAFVLARDVAPNDASALASPASVIGETRCSFELVRSRYVDRRAVGWPSFVGDSVGFEALVIGAPVALDQIERIGAEAIVDLDGRAAARGLLGDERTDPMLSLATLLAHAGERGITLKRGEIFTTGAAAQPFDVVARADGSAQIGAHWPGGRLDATIAFDR